MSAAELVDLETFRRKREERKHPQALTPPIVWCWEWVWPTPFLQR